MKAKRSIQNAKTEKGFLVNVARSIGSVLGSVAASTTGPVAPPPRRTAGTKKVKTSRSRKAGKKRPS